MKKFKVNPFDFKFKRIDGNRVLMTNECGGNIVVSGKVFNDFIDGKLNNENCPEELIKNNFVSEMLDFDKYEYEFGQRYFANWKAPHIHIISLSAVCNLSCVYCSASAKKSGTKVMSKKTADKILDFIFSLNPEKYLIEFQGGEPLMQFETLKYIVSSAKKRALKKNKEIYFSVVTNLWYTDEKIFNYLVGNNITVCASLDGPANVHNANRPCEDNSAYDKTVYWLKRFCDYCKKNNLEVPNAICTVTKNSLPFYKDIVDEYLKQGVKRLQLGPVDPLGRAKINWDKIGVSSKEFLKFYKNALNYILKLNKSGIDVYEKAALAFVKQIFGAPRPRYQNLDILYRLAYNWDGRIYGSDEARMLANGGDDFFELGDVYKNDFKSVIESPIGKYLIASALSSFNQPLCSRCPFSLYCRIPPVYNYAVQNNPNGNMIVNERCILYKGVYELLSELNSDKNNNKIFQKWNESYD